MKNQPLSNGVPVTISLFAGQIFRGALNQKGTKGNENAQRVKLPFVEEEQAKRAPREIAILRR